MTGCLIYDEMGRRNKKEEEADNDDDDENRNPFDTHDQYQLLSLFLSS